MVKIHTETSEQQQDIEGISDVSTNIPEFYQTNKMRYWLKAAGMSKGMKAEHGFYTTFYDGMAINIPNYYTIWIQGSDELVRLYPDQVFRFVIIWKTELTFEQQIAKMTYSGMVQHISNIPIFGPAISGTIQEFSELALKAEQINSIQNYKVWPHLLYKHTLGDNVLQANYWDVIDDIMPLIIKKYG